MCVRIRLGLPLQRTYICTYVLAPIQLQAEVRASKPDQLPLVSRWIWYVSVLLLQKLLKSAGKEGKHTVFLLADTQIKEESFLEDVDGLLNAGEVANLFNLEERTEVLEVREGVACGSVSVSLCV